MSEAARKIINPFEKVRETEFGCFELHDKPSRTELNEYYANKYYQQSIRVHEKTYAEKEIQFRKNKLEQNRLKAESLNAKLARGGCRFLDVGAGEGFAMAHFEGAGWEVAGLDYSRYGCEEPTWAAIPDYVSHFIHEGLESLAAAAGLKQKSVMTDFPIDFALFNPLTSYMVDKTTGKSCHLARVEIENMMHAISAEGVNRLYESLAALGLGRQITGFYSLA